MQNHELFLRQALALARTAVDGETCGDKGASASIRGPFGAVVVKDGSVIATGYNQVVASCDPTAHAEIMALRAAGQHLATHNLKGCTLYSSCEPCPMCLSAAYWARIDAVWYVLTRHDAAEIGFDDAFIYEEFARPLNQRSLPIERINIAGAKDIFLQWNQMPRKIRY
jgi:guanine deaminase